MSIYEKITKDHVFVLDKLKVCSEVYLNKDTTDADKQDICRHIPEYLIHSFIQLILKTVKTG